MRPVALGAVLGVSLLGCGGDGGGDDSPPEPSSAADACDGVLSGEAAKALDFLAGTTSFSADDTGNTPGLPKVAAALSDDYERLGGSANPDLVPACWIRKSGGTVAAEIEFGMATEQAVVSTSKVPNLAHYEAGRGAFANGKFTYLYFDCVGPKLAGSSDSDPAVVFGKLRNAVQSGEEDEPADGPGPIREANLTVLHSVAYKLAQELGCRGDGGLTEKVTLTTGS